MISWKVNNNKYNSYYLLLFHFIELFIWNVKYMTLKKIFVVENRDGSD